MGLWELFLLAVGLSMDAFAVSICKGLSVAKVNVRQSVVAGLYFGVFQAVMPLVGWLLGVQFQGLIQQFDHWIAFILLALIGFNMIRESRKEEGGMDRSFAWRAMLPLAVATSIDALAVGVTFAFLQMDQVDILSAISFIGIVTFLLCSVGVRLGNKLGSKCQQWAQLAGGIILIAMGAKILLEHLEVFG